MINLKISKMLKKYRVSKDEIWELGKTKNKHNCMCCDKEDIVVMLPLEDNKFLAYCEKCWLDKGYIQFINSYSLDKVEFLKNKEDFWENNYRDFSDTCDVCTVCDKVCEEMIEIDWDDLHSDYICKKCFFGGDLDE